MTKRTITITDRPPVKIDEDAWPVLATASDKEFDNEYEFQANCVSKWGINVRQHEDGRTLVYATYSYSSNWANSRGYSAKHGVMLDSFALREAKDDDAAIVTAINDVCDTMAACEHAGEDAERWKTLADECIADMPSQELA